jgi:CRP/FNR family transcriptional regulator, cyclic AMP receptor protein
VTVDLEAPRRPVRDPRAAGEVQLVRVLEVDPGLRRLVRAERLRRMVVVDAVRLPAGTALSVDVLGAGVFALLVIDGFLCRRARIADRAGVELLGPGDVVRPWQDESSLASRFGAVTWQVVDPARVAVLDGEFLALVARSPEVVEELMTRLVRRCHALADRLAMARIPRLEERLLALLWHLGDRWGHIERDRVAIPMRLRHGLLADLACAHRPPVTGALNRLALDGRIERNVWQGWDLLGSPPV